MKKLIFALTVMVLGATSCKKEYDSPPGQTIATGDILTVGDLRAMFNGTSHKFVGDSSVYAVVTADETDGNFYKEVYIQDNTGAINVRLLASGGLYIGDSIRINLKGTVLSMYNDVMQLDSVDVDVNVIKQATQKDRTPDVVTINQINPSIQGHLVTLNNVEFSAADQGMTYADGVNNISRNLTLVDCNGNSVLVRTSGYANFANEVIPDKNGTITAIVGQFGTDMQLLLRSSSEVDFTATSCAPPLSKDFEDLSISSGGWTTQQVIGTDNWATSSFGADNFARISNYDGSSNTATEAWYISPSVDVTNLTAPVFSFDNTYNYAGAPLEVYVSTDYSGFGAPSAATWTALSPTLSSGSWAWVNSGEIDLTAYSSTNLYVAFKYVGSASDGSTWEIDNIVIKEQ